MIAIGGTAVGVFALGKYAAGGVCFAFGALGALLPGIPTTGPMLLALACFARGSDRLHDWLLNHRIFGPSLQRWQRHRLIPLKAKVAAIGSMSLSLAYLVFWSPVPTWAVILIAAVMLAGAAFILSCRHRLS